MLQFDQERSLLSLLLGAQRIERGLLAAVEAHGLNVNGGNRNDVGTVLGIEIIKVRGVLEVVGVHGAVFDDGVGHDVVVVGLDIEGDVLLGKDRLGNLKDLSVRGRGSGNRDGRVFPSASERVILTGTGSFR